MTGPPATSSTVSGYDGVGNLTEYIDSTVMGTWTFSYDTLNRLSLGTQTPISGSGQSTQSFCWAYDAFGNRTTQGISNLPFTNAAGAALCQFASSGAALGNTWVGLSAANNNQLANTSQAPGGVSYDPAGDMLNDGVNQYLYDGEGRICAVFSSSIAGMTTMTGYLYDADGTRVAKGSISAWSCDPAVNGFSTTNDYILGPSGEQMTEMAMDTSIGGANTLAWQHSNVWAGAKLLATYDADGLHFYFDDPLGSRRVQTDYAGVVEKSCQNLPFGDGETCQPTPTENLFTGKERDSESGNDYFGARYYASPMGRFLSPDQVFADQHTANPQSWNLYAYGRDNPLRYIDPSGNSIYAVFYTQGNDKNTHSDDGGDAAFHDAAETLANNLRHSAGFDPKKDIALTFGINSKQDFIDDLQTIKQLQPYFGKVTQLDIFSHSGNDGPVFPSQPGSTRWDRQFLVPGKKAGIDLSQLRSLDISWESNAFAAFYGCHTHAFAYAFHQAQGVNTFGYRGFMSFFAAEDGWLEYPYSRANTKPGYRGPLYPGSKHIIGDFNDYHQKWLPF